MSTSSEKASDIVREKLLANGGTAVISLQKGDPCMIVLADNGSAVTSDKLHEFHYELRFLYKGIIIKHNKTEPTYTKTSLFLCEKRRFFMARTEKGVVATI